MVTSTRILGNVKPDDEYMHPLGPEDNFNESMYFNFFDRGRQTGGFLRLGNRANEGYAEMTLCLYLPDGSVLFNFDRSPIDNNDAFDAGGMKFEVVEPVEQLRTSYDGGAVLLTDPLQMADPKKAFTENPKKRIKLDLLQEAVGPLYGHVSERQSENPEEEFARAHYEQHMRATGTLEIDGEALEIDGLGLRDHSWGPRYWQALSYYRWLTCNFGPDFGFMGSEVVRHDGSKTQGGVVVRDGQLTNVKAINIQTDFDEAGLYHRKFQATLGLEGDETLVVDGAVKSFIPLRNRREGKVTHIGEGMTEYRCGEHVGYGLSEYLDQVR
ncbi:MAG TPA: hypothetical protein VFO84_03230 [Dehalococcoidia bacterium]|nr:hypothetical protein [Dehalococcoidia bacterium]